MTPNVQMEKLSISPGHSAGHSCGSSPGLMAVHSEVGITLIAGKIGQWGKKNHNA